MKKQLWNELNQKLAEEKERLLEVETSLIDSAGLDQPFTESITELSAYDNHPADSASQLAERSKDFGLLELTREQIKEIEAAQLAIAEGHYGYCKNCGQTITQSRLLALPSALLCVQCKRSEEERAEIEGPMETISPEDGDAWDAVARYGTSSYIEKD